MDPSPTAPVPIIGGGHSAPALRRAAELCDGWVAAGAYEPEQAREYLKLLHEARRHAGRQNAPFEIFLSLWAQPDLDMYRSFEEEFGVTDMLCAPAMVADVDPAASSEAQLQTRLDASARFAQDVVEKMR
jgi:alkanesulfonate monooxygenase SsuD/methylene tetrahydromethanopterin reductase-like flavin-dependent oxidoreductase (luciferase family)